MTHTLSSSVLTAGLIKRVGELLFTLVSPALRVGLIAECPQRGEYHKKYRQKLRRIVLEYYGGNPPKCACCGENHIEFLCIDHINGGGNEHLRKIGIAYLYAWLRKKNFPKGYRVLCHNCNISLGNYNYCPHQNVSE